MTRAVRSLCRRVLFDLLCGGFAALAFVGCAGIRRDATPSAFAESVTFLRVELDCPIVSNLACGSEAKPFLQRLDKRREIKKSWLDRSGTIMAIEWESAPGPALREAALAAVTLNKRCPLETKVLNATERARVATAFHARNGWYQAAEMDQLTAEEAERIAARLVSRMSLAADLPSSKAQSLRSSIAAILTERLTATGKDPLRRGLRGVTVRILKIAEPLLTEAELEALDHALRGGFAAAPYEP